MTHTKGLYASDANGNWRVMANDANGGYTVADMCCDDQAAHAKLFAAAPDLLEALQAVIAISDRDHEAWHRAKTAIAKSLGHEVTRA
jgi:hypothetical protein